ncbi:Uncharacterised protein [Streptococcus pneumoniae]|nr:Uncharacterised protein [Streptococcus pneumoniae]
MVAKTIEYASDPQLGISTGHVSVLTLSKQYITRGPIPIKVDHDVTLIAEYFVMSGCAKIGYHPHAIAATNPIIFPSHAYS